MRLGTAIAIYFLIWWVTLFAVLPFGVRSQHEDTVTPGTDPGAPVKPMLLRKALWTTVISAVVFAAFYGAIQSGWLALDRLPVPFGSAVGQ